MIMLPMVLPKSGQNILTEIFDATQNIRFSSGSETIGENILGALTGK
jgi:hypothetical protein